MWYYAEVNTTYSTGKAAKLLGVSIRTLQQWDRDRKLIAKRTPSGRRFYTDDQIRDFLSEPKKLVFGITVAYIRVSSQAQKPDLKNQRSALEQFCVAGGLIVDEWIEEIGLGVYTWMKSSSAFHMSGYNGG